MKQRRQEEREPRQRDEPQKEDEVEYKGASEGKKHTTPAHKA